ncbi:MAG: hypothetical protein E2O98_01890 [Acidobacteria bacterium]|nr:MAG: hypothetical protein E2O98_01890 [Acidobacteriota bacterium]
MAVNPDPKPGRWILPLVILGMIAFTFFFVRELPEASPDTTLAGQPTTTTVPDSPVTTVDGDGGELDPETQAYLDELDVINAALQLLTTEMVTVNDGFDADPREIEYEDAEPRLEVVVEDTTDLSDQVTNMDIPAGLEVNHDVLKTAVQFASLAAGDALDGLRSSDTGERRQVAVEAYVQATEDFNTEVTNAHNAAENTT